MEYLARKAQQQAGQQNAGKEAKHIDPMHRTHSVEI
jgi:hypothetical protein